MTKAEEMAKVAQAELDDARVTAALEEATALYSVYLEVNSTRHIFQESRPANRSHDPEASLSFDLAQED